ncbi:MAG: DUF3108 domain-containing protein, partial [Verrucomicrobia bacterium]|nr:DUF3108 domain-containing protein [Verrucomicrobiota bacterium]
RSGRGGLCARLVLLSMLSMLSGARAEEDIEEAPKFVENIGEYVTLSNVVGNAGYTFGFQVGEELVYRVYWGWIPVGKSRIVTRWVEKDGKRYIAIVHRTRSSSVISAIYPVNDRLESIVDPDTFLPAKFSKNLHEGRHRYHETTWFDHPKKEAHWVSFRKQTEKTYAIKADTRDMLCFLYYIRSMKMAEGNVVKAEVMADEKLYDLEVNVYGVDEVRTKGFGKVKARKLEPKAKFDGLFVRKGKMNTWASLDDRFVAVRIEADLPFANVKVLLAEVHGPGDDFWIRNTIERLNKGEKDEKDEAEVDAALRDIDG